MPRAYVREYAGEQKVIFEGKEFVFTDFCLIKTNEKGYQSRYPAPSKVRHNGVEYCLGEINFRKFLSPEGAKKMRYMSRNQEGQLGIDNLEMIKAYSTHL